MKRSFFPICFFLTALFFHAMGVGPSLVWAGEPIHAFVSIPPQKFFVERIGGGHVAVTVMVAPHQSPENYEPLPSQMVGLARADLYFAIGAPFERTWLDKFASAHPGVTIVHTDTGIQKRPMDRRGDGSLKSGSHAHGGLDPHIWLSPNLSKIQCRHIRDALAAADPPRKAVYDEHCRLLIKDIDALHQSITKIFSDLSGKKQFLVFHPSWGYFADDYGLTQVPLEIEGKEPKARELQELIRQAKTSGLRVVFVQPQFSTRHAEIIANAIGGRIDILDPLAPDWPDNLLRAAHLIHRSFQASTP